MNDRIRNWFIATGFAVVLCGCQTIELQNEVNWYALRVADQSGFAVPECVVADGEGNVFVANILPHEGVYWGDDGKGFVTRLGVRGSVESRYFVGGRKDSPLHSPKGMCILDGWLYVNDATQLKRCSLKYPRGTLEVTKVTPGEKYNDAATDGRYVWISDMARGKVVRYDPYTGSQHVIPAPPGVNGLTIWNGRVFAVSWTKHEIYELDPTGSSQPRSFGLADHFTNLDGIEVLDDGTFIVSDFKGNKVCTVSADGKTVRTLIEIESPADIGIDRKRGLLYVPQFKKDKVVIYRLIKR
jgi:hypothetical protein